MDVQQNLIDEVYMTKLPYPARPVKPALLKKRINEVSDEEIVEARVLLKNSQADEAQYRVDRDAYEIDVRRLEKKFQADLETEYGVVGHPRAQRLFEIAWSNGHSGGFREVYNQYIELVDLIIGTTVIGE